MKHIFLNAHFVRALITISVIFSPTPANSMQKLRALFSRGKTLNFPIAIYSFERVKKDENGKPMFDKDGKPVVEQLHAIGDTHIGHPYEHTQVNQVVERIQSQKNKNYSGSLTVENGKKNSLLYKINDALEYFFHKVVTFNKNDGQRKPAAFLSSIHAGCVQKDLPTQDVEFNRHALSPGSGIGTISCKPYPNTNSVSHAVQVLEECVQEAQQLSQRDSVVLPDPIYTIAGLRNRLAQKNQQGIINADTTVFDLYKTETGKTDIDEAYIASINMADTNISTYMFLLGWQLIDQRAYIHSSRYQKETDRYLALGTLHLEGLSLRRLEGINAWLQKDGWRLVHQSGVHTSKQNDPKFPKVQQNNRFVGECDSVDIEAHFRTLPPRESSLKFSKKLVGGIPAPALPTYAKFIAGIMQKRSVKKPIDQDEDAAKRTVKLKWE